MKAVQNSSWAGIAVDALFVLLVLSASLPLRVPLIQSSLETWFSFRFPFSLSLGSFFLPPLLLVAMTVQRSRIHACRQTHRTAWLILLGLLLVMWIGSFLSDYTAHSIKHAARYTVYLLAFFVLTLTVTKETFHVCANLFLGFYIVLTALTWMDNEGLISIRGTLNSFGLHLQLFTGGARSSSLFENPNPYAIISAATAFLALHQLYLRQWLFGALALVASGYGLITAGSRNGIFTVVVTLMLLILWNAWKRKFSGKSLALAAVVLVATGTALWNIDSRATNMLRKEILNMTFPQNYGQLEHKDPRFALFRLALVPESAKNWIVGSGVKTFGLDLKKRADGRWKGTLIGGGETFNAHNALLTVWYEMGLLGIAGCLGFILVWVKKIVKHNPFEIGPVLALCVGQIFDFFLWEILFMTCQSFILAAMVNAPRNGLSPATTV